MFFLSQVLDQWLSPILPASGLKDLASRFVIAPEHRPWLAEVDTASWSNLLGVIRLLRLTRVFKVVGFVSWPRLPRNKHCSVDCCLNFTKAGVGSVLDRTTYLPVLHWPEP